MPAPIRTCVGCRRRVPKHELVRVVWRDGRSVLQGAQWEPGRGAYLCPREECWQQARRRAVARALRVERIDEDLLEHELRKVWRKSGFTS